MENINKLLFERSEYIVQMLMIFLEEISKQSKILEKSPTLMHNSLYHKIPSILSNK